MKDKVLRYLGLGARGRLLAVGYTTCIFLIGKGKVKMIILAEDLAKNSVEKMTAAAAKNNIPYRIYGSKEELSHITGKENAGIFGVTEENLSRAILEEIDHIQSM